MGQLLSISRHTSNNYNVCKDMPVHIFISLGNILATQFKEEAEKQKKEQEKSNSNLPNFNSLPNVSNILSNFNVPSFNL